LLLQLERWSDDKAPNKKPRQQQEEQDQDQGPPEQQQPQQEQPYRYTLQLLVPPGQLELGRRLITAMYSSSPDLSDLEAPQLMQLVLLADCYGVGKVITAAAAALQRQTTNNMQLETALAVFELPPACLAMDAFTPVERAAADALQRACGDLEVVWGSAEGQKRLLGLSCSTLLRLLVDPRTRAASEDTAVYTAATWLRENKASPARYAMLAAALRLPHCTASFLASLAGDGTTMQPDSAWVWDGNPRLLADLLAASGRTPAERSKWLQYQYTNKPAWRAPQRPPSSMQVLALCWDLPLATLQGVVQAEQEGGPGCLWCPHRSLWQGRVWRLSLSVTGPSVSLYLHTEGAAGFFSGELRVVGLSPRTGSVHTFNGTHVDSDGRGLPMLSWDAGWEWSRVAALLKAGWVHPDGCLHIRGGVTRVA
jgi:hypothetical protein